LEVSEGNTYYKIIRTGHILEVYKYDKPPPDNTQAIKWGDDDDFPYHDIYQKTRNPFTADKEWIKVDKTPGEWKKSNAINRRNKARRLLSANFDRNSKFVTLTFAENVTDLDEANREFTKFIQRLRRRYDNFQYLAVVEFQKRGAVHYHMISDLPYIANSKLRDLWRNGFVRINNIDHVNNIGAYVVKYMTKEGDNEKLQGRKTYFPSRGLKQPEEIRGDTAEAILSDIEIEKKFPVIGNTYDTEYMGKCEYAQYNLEKINC
jgi:hypothetical protein